MSLNNGVLEASGLDFGSPRARFWRVRARFFEVLDIANNAWRAFWVANTLPPTCPASLGRSRARSGRDLAEPQDICLECLCFRVLAAMGEMLTEWVAGGVPALGAFNGIETKVAIVAPNNFGTAPFQIFLR